MTYAYHGNWCGPGWSDGRRVSSTHGFAPAIDEFDETCRQHDFALSGGKRNPTADMTFIRKNLLKGPKRGLAALLVGGRMAVDMLTAANKSSNSPRKMTKPALEKMTKKNKHNEKPVEKARAPVAVGTVFRSVKTTHTQTKNGSVLSGSDFIGAVEGQGVATFGLGKSALLSPAYFLATFLGNISRSYEKYRWRKLRINYVPKVSTGLNGQVILCSSHSVSEPCLQPEAGTFLARAMSQGNASMGPLWMENHIDIQTGNSWYMVDPTTTTDPDDAIAEELQVYVQTQTVGQVGYLYVEYEIEFSQLTYQPHSTSIPISTGPGVRVVLNDAAATNAANDDWSLADSAGTLGLATLANGSIFRAAFDLQGSSCYTGSTFGAGFRTLTASRSNTLTTTSFTTAQPIVGGSTFYLVVNGTNMQVYTSLEAAVNGNGSGQVFMSSAGTVVGTYNFDCQLIRQGISTISTVQ